MFIFHLYEYATDVLCKFGELILREPYGYELNGDIFMLPLSDDALVNDIFRQPPKEEESPICAWDQLSRWTSIELSLATGQEYVVWQNRGSLGRGDSEPGDRQRQQQWRFGRKLDLVFGLWRHMYLLRWHQPYEVAADQYYRLGGP